MWQRGRWRKSHAQAPAEKPLPDRCVLCNEVIGLKTWVMCLAWPGKPVHLKCMHEHVEAMNVMTSILKSEPEPGSTPRDAGT